MKQGISLFLLLIISHISARDRLLSSHQLGDSTETKTEEIAALQNDDVSILMGLEECGGKNEACQKGRMVAEAHLDYIYTQHHKP